MRTADEPLIEALTKFLLSHLQYCADTGIQFTSQIRLPDLTQFRARWKDDGLSGSKKLERLRAFGRFLVDRGWWEKNLALNLKRPKVTTPPTMPYTKEDILGLLSACTQLRDSADPSDKEGVQRLYALLLLLRYSGLRIGDAASCPVDRLDGNRLFLYTQKTKVPVYIPLPGFVVAALDACPRKSDRYWFWSGVGSKDTLTGNWRRTFRRLCRLAGVHEGHPHRFRDTLAVELLLEGVPMERVSILLGHSSVKITERHYAPWVHSRQAQLEADVERVWRKDPLAQAAILHGEVAPPDGSPQRMVATYSRHEKVTAPN